MSGPVRYVLIGDGQSPHLLKWARALAQRSQPACELHLLSSRGFLPGFDELVPPARRLALNTLPAAAGGNAALLLHLPRAALWLKARQPQVLHAHYLTSHGTLAWLAQRLFGVPGVLVGSAWGSDILVAPQRSALVRALTRRVLGACDFSTSDSQHMAAQMRALGAGEVLVFPFGLETMPPPASAKDPDLFFTNRGLEPLYRPMRVLEAFAHIARQRPQARLAVANRGSLELALRGRARELGIDDRVQWLGLLEPQQQADWYARAAWYLSLPESDSVAVSVLEAMAHGCLPLLSDLPANRELVVNGRSGHNGCNGLIVGEDADAFERLAQALPGLQARAEEVAAHNRTWVERHGRFEPGVQACWSRLLQALGRA